MTKNFSTRRARKLLEAAAAWLQFEKMCYREPLFGERYLSYPVGQFLNARFANRVRAEHPHPILASAATGPGGKPKIDFAVLGDNDQIEVAIETKWLSKSPTLARDIVRDLIRLELVANAGAKALLVLGGRNKDLRALFAQAAFLAHPNHTSSKPLLPSLDDRAETRVLRIESPPRYRHKFIEGARNTFRIEIASTIVIQKLKPSVHEGAGDYQVLGWMIRADQHRTTFCP